MDLLTPLRRGWRYYLAVTAIGWGVGTLEAWLSAKASQADELDERIAEAEARDAELTARIEAKLAELNRLGELYREGLDQLNRVDVDPLGRGKPPEAGQGVPLVDLEALAELSRMEVASLVDHEQLGPDEFRREDEAGDLVAGTGG